MGSIISNASSTKIYKIDAPKSPSDGDQTVVYSTTEGRTLTFSAVVGVRAAGVQTANFSLRDNTCTRSGTSIDLKFRLRPSSGIMAMKKLNYEGDILDVELDDDGPSVSIEYGAVLKRGIFYVTGYSTGTGAPGFVVLHLLVTGSDSCLVMFRVWYDAGKGYFECDRIGPFRRPSVVELKIDIEYALRHSSDAASSTGVNQTAIAGRINNDGRVRGNFNGAINNFFNNFYANR